jgi:iron complex outermembrane receptor protein
LCFSVIVSRSRHNHTNSPTNLLSFDANDSGELFDLPGGPLQVAVGGQFRYESIDAPSANADFAGPTERYLVINAFGTKGSREVY